MKCINCGTDNKLPERIVNEGRCKECHHPFVFEPTTMGKYKVTDAMFAKAIADISGKNTLYFTPKQLFYFLDSRLRPKSFPVIYIPVLIFIYLFFNVWLTGFIGIGGLFLLMLLISIVGSILLFLGIPNIMGIDIVGIMIGFINPSNGINYVIIANAISQLYIIYFLQKLTKSPELNYIVRRQTSQSLQLLGIFLIISGVAGSIYFNSYLMLIIFPIIGILSVYVGTKQLNKVQLVNQEPLFKQIDFQAWLEKWQNINGVTSYLLNKPQETLNPANINPEVTAYSFDRLVVCDSANIAQLLIANNFHFENNCAILSITGYPQSIFETTMEMLRRNPNLQVFAFHDCSPKGVSLIHHLRSSENWFFNSDVTIIDVGLLPRQILANKRGMFIQNTASLAKKSTELPLEGCQTLSAEELAWLDAGNFIELESFSSQILIKVLRNGISGSLNLESDDSSMILIGDSGNDIYMVESFG
ncbi:MAG: hypothetical protein ACKO3K_05870 [Cuspidothrix sp.]